MEVVIPTNSGIGSEGRTHTGVSVGLYSRTTEDTLKDPYVCRDVCTGGKTQGVLTQSRKVSGDLQYRDHNVEIRQHFLLIVTQKGRLRNPYHENDTSRTTPVIVVVGYLH